MSLRIKLTAFFLAMVTVLALNGDPLRFGIEIDMFLALGVMAVASVLLLWPEANQDDRIARKLASDNWADRIDVEALAREARSRLD